MGHTTQHQVTRHITGSLVGRLWRSVTEPPDVVQNPERRRHMRFLSSLLVILVPLSMLGTIVSYEVTSSVLSPFQDPAFNLLMGGCVVLAVAYGLGRTEKYYTVGAAITLTATSLMSIAITILLPQDVENLLIYLSLAILLGSLLLSLRGTIILAVANTLAVLLLPTLAPGIATPSVVNVFIFVALMSALIVVSAVVNQRHLEQIEQQSRTLSEMYEESRNHTKELQLIFNRLEAILNSVGEGLMVISLDGYIEQVNPAFEEQTGYKAEEVVHAHHNNLRLGSLMPDSVVEEAYVAMDAERTWHGEMPIERRDGTSYDAAVTISPVRSHDGEVIAFACSVRDITALKQVQRMKDAFVSNVSHELRTPITSFKLFLGLLSSAAPEVRRRYLATLERETDRLYNIIEDVLRISRLDQGRVELNLQTVNLNTLTSQYVSDRELLAMSKGVRLTQVEHPAMPPARADERLLGQVLGILLTNAINYTPPGGQVVAGTGTCEIDGKEWAGFSVSDTGPGISPEEEPQLFQRFFRGKVGRESGSPGTGLGLAIAKEIVDLHSGQIEVSNEGVLGKGTTFRVWLPVEYGKSHGKPSDR